ncbi:HemX protein [Pasteurellaceae bacterium RH1A]|nr:HemX protein [Pasteurellaceae bacterium RH1A]
MSKQKREVEDLEVTEVPVEQTEATVEAEQAVHSEPELTNEPEEGTQEELKEEPLMENTENTPAPEAKKSGGTGLALLALLVALGLGGAGYYFGSQKLASLEANVQQQLAGAVNKLKEAQPEQMQIELPNFDAEKVQIATLSSNYQQAQQRISQLEREQAVYTQQINSLQQQIQQLGNMPKADTSTFLLSDADFLLNNAIRKMVLDNDMDTTKNLLIEADKVLAQVSDSGVLAVREAIKADLNQLSSINEVDQNALMLRLTQLANRLDDMPLLDNDNQEEGLSTGEVSDSIADYAENLEKSANSFLNHFIRVSDKGATTEKAFVAPHQEIYLRENIRLRLQIAILAIPRQQNELYKQSLDAVGTWVRSYFDLQNENVKSFLKDLDTLNEQSIYIDAPKQLQSLNALDQLLNKQSPKVEKIEMEAEKALEPAAEPQGQTPALPEAEAQPQATPAQ